MTLRKRHLQKKTVPALLFPVQMKAKTGEEQNQEELFWKLMCALLKFSEHFVCTSVLVSIAIFSYCTLPDSVKFHLLLVSSQELMSGLGIVFLHICKHKQPCSFI